MKVVAIAGSPRKNGNTARMLRRVLASLEAEGVETELIELAGKKAQGCTACLKCRERKDRRCHGRNDAINECIAKVDEADGVIVGSPVYFADISAETKALIDRLGYVAGANPGMLERKVAAAVVAERRAGAVHAFDSIMHMFLIRQMIIAGSTYWNLGIGGLPGDVEEDEEGMRTMDTLGRNMAWLLEHTAAHR
ncbi:flavodoxin family protein [Anaerosoma tenue]|uniref:flavodoxin family protein n=1 Tax=Anaerosoma tenue TaxID=2933588 RepID=UPI002260E40A|nr:flavodoxin family protein [Anaerosoma tenue]MCK8115509.1 flavodoxin family protein [Anaerosoma tenue]